MRALGLVSLAVVSITLPGCTVGPNYERPEVAVPANWRLDLPTAQNVANTRWWEQFGDPVLNGLIETALRENLDVSIASARVDQFLGVLTTARSQALPQLGYGANATYNRAPQTGFPALPPHVDPVFSLYQATLAASWQIDLFGRVRRLTEAAQAQVYGSEQAQRGVVLSLVAAVANGYLTMRGLDRQREIAAATAENFGETVRIFNLRFSRGLVSETDLNEATAQYKLAQVTIPLLDQQIATLENAISILLARNPGPIPRGQPLDKFLLPAIPADLPSAILERRPDVLQAEQNLVAANANVGATRALYYPTISLTGLLGSTSVELGDFLSGPATTWSVGGGLIGPIFTSGAISGQVHSAEAQKSEAELVYRRTILGALSDTNNALIGSAATDEQAALQQERVDALRRFARLSRMRFESGLTSYLEVQIAELDLFSAELALTSLSAQRYTQLVSVYQAMGGGWVDLADALTPTPVAPATND